MHMCDQLQLSSALSYSKGLRVQAQGLGGEALQLELWSHIAQSPGAGCDGPPGTWKSLDFGIGASDHFLPAPLLQLCLAQSGRQITLRSLS